MRSIGFIATVFLLSLFVGCAGNVIPDPGPGPIFRIVIDESSTSIRDGQTVSPNSVIRLAWEKVAGQVLLCNFHLYRDNQTVQTMNSVEEVIFSVVEEGAYVAELIAVGVRSEPVRLSFSVTRLFEELYQSPGGRILTEFSDSYLCMDTFYINFFRYASSVLPGTGETIHQRDAMNLKDTNGDGVFDFWEILPNAFAEYVSLPCVISRYNTSWRIFGMQYEEHAIAIVYYGISGDYANYYLSVPLASVGFEIGVPFARHIYDSAATVNHYVSYTLRERYETDEHPDLSLELRTANPSRANDFVVAVSAEQAAAFAKIYETRYMQLGVAFDPRLTLKNVVYPNFMEGVRDISGYRLNAEGNGVLLYRGFIEGEEENAAISKDFALITFEVKTGETPDWVDLSLIYTDDLTDYANFPDAPNPVFKNRYNRFVDGFIVQHAPIRIFFSNTGVGRE